MFIVWGKTIKRQRLGFVADYCAVCRDVRSFQLKRIGSASHVYYISFGEGDLVGYERVCQSCGTPFEAVPDTYSGISQVARAGSELINETFPNYFTVYRDQIESARKARDTPSLLTSAERRGLLREPFQLQAQLVQQKLASIQIDGRVWLAVGAFIPITWLVGGISRFIVGTDDDNAAVRAGLIGAALGLALLVSQLATSGRRYVLKYSLPHISSALAPLRPSEAEVDEILGELRQHNAKLGGKLNAAEVIDAIEKKRQAVWVQ